MPSFSGEGCGTSTSDLLSGGELRIGSQRLTRERVELGAWLRQKRLSKASCTCRRGKRQLCQQSPGLGTASLAGVRREDSPSCPRGSQTIRWRRPEKRDMGICESWRREPNQSQLISSPLPATSVLLSNSQPGALIPGFLYISTIWHIGSILEHLRCQRSALKRMGLVKRT